MDKIEAFEDFDDFLVKLAKSKANKKKKILNLKKFVEYWEERGEKPIKITGSEVNFSEEFDTPKALNKRAKELWNMDEWHGYSGEQLYYNFLKFLWIEYPDGSEERLVELLNRIGYDLDE